MVKLPIHGGILAWHSGQTLVDTLLTYHNNGLFELIDTTILFQEATEIDEEIANHFGVKYIALENNIGIGAGFIYLAKSTYHPYFITLEHDWKLIEDKATAYERLSSGINLIENNGIDCVRYRHRQHPGNPHFSFRHRGNELNYYDDEIGCTSPHLLDSVHWLDPAESFPEQIKKRGDYFVTTSRWGNWTNNPCLYKRDFYIETTNKFDTGGISLEGKISKWWAESTWGVAHGEGLFTHIDNKKYGG